MQGLPHARRAAIAAAFATALLCVAGPAARAQPTRGAAATPPSGTWQVAFPAGADTIWIRFALRFAGDSIVGTDPGNHPVRGTLRRDSVSFLVLDLPDSARVHFAGVLRDGVMRGRRVDTAHGATVPRDSAEFLAMPELATSRPPRLHAFAPREFHRWFTGAVAPALRLVPGDTVRTWSLDAGGRDSAGVARSRGGNPLTGPFHVEGAMPGDVLAVRLHRVRLDRDWAFAGTEVVWNALTPAYVRGVRGAPLDGRWRLDRVRGVATPAQPTPALRALALPVRPMLGSVGVAPPNGQVIRTSDSGPFGGNMDYNEIREGTTVYLPVFQRGALLFVGDGHALQGDGELTGDALETSMSFEFSVELLRRHAIVAPRAENDEFLMAIGISGDLTDALRRATSELARWLEADYRIGAPEVASLLGASVRYDVADLVGAQVSIVAKMPKAVLRGLDRAARP
jgi:acetamidase/formamidase